MNRSFKPGDLLTTKLVYRAFDIDEAARVRLKRFPAVTLERRHSAAEAMLRFLDHCEVVLYVARCPKAMCEYYGDLIVLTSRGEVGTVMATAMTNVRGGRRDT